MIRGSRSREYRTTWSSSPGRVPWLPSSAACSGTPSGWPAGCSLALKVLYDVLAGVAPLQFLGAYGLAIILLTVVIKVVLSPLYHFQLSVSRKTQAEQRRIAPEVAAVRKKFKNEPQKQQAAL